MKGDINIKINKKSALTIIAAIGFYAYADFVSVIDTKSSGGVNILSSTTITDTDVNNAINEALPIGTMAMWVTETPPTGWIEMRGQSTGSYPELAAVIGSTVPDMRGVFARGWNNDASVDSGRTIKSYQDDENKEHDHSLTIDWTDLGTKTTTASGAHSHNYTAARHNEYNQNYGSGGWQIWDGGWTQTTTTAPNHQHSVVLGSHNHSGTIGSSGSESRPKNIAVMYIIKAK